MSKLTLLETGRSGLSIPPAKIAVEGCVSTVAGNRLTTSHANRQKCHGSLDNIYNSLESACESRGWAVAELDFLIICGDFQENTFPRSVHFEFVINMLSGYSQPTRFELHVRPLEISKHRRLPPVL